MVPPNIWEIKIRSVLFALYNNTDNSLFVCLVPPNLKHIKVFAVDVVTDFSAAFISKA